jgi:hypothetical protein
VIKHRPQAESLHKLLQLNNNFTKNVFFSFQAHHFMSEDDLRRIFQVEHHNDGKILKRLLVFSAIPLSG